MQNEGAFFDTNDYELQKKKLGNGTYGSVYIANNVNNHKKYATKFIKIDNGFNGPQQMLLIQKSSLICKLKHPSIAKFVGVNFQSFTDPNKFEPSIMTKYCRHGSLKRVFDNEKKGIIDNNWTPTKKCISLLGISDALRYLHQNGIVHHDLKPENVLIGRN